MTSLHAAFMTDVYNILECLKTRHKCACSGFTEITHVRIHITSLFNQTYMLHTSIQLQSWVISTLGEMHQMWHYSKGSIDVRYV